MMAMLSSSGDRRKDEVRGDEKNEKERKEDGNERSSRTFYKYSGSSGYLVALVGPSPFLTRAKVKRRKQSQLVRR
jgi:hypothetical protein